MWYQIKQSAVRANHLFAVVIIIVLASSLPAIAQKMEKQNIQSVIVPANDSFSSATVITSPVGAASGNTSGATKEPGEPGHAGNVGGSSVWFSWTAGASDGMTFTLRSSTTSFDTLLAVYTGTQVDALTPIVANDDYGSTPSLLTSTVFFPTVPGTTYRIAVDGYDGASGAYVMQWHVSRINRAVSTFNGTGSSAVTIFRPSTGTWWTTSTNGIQAFKFGTNGDVPSPADFDGDLVTDYCVFRNGVWYVLRSLTSTYGVISWGLAGDKPMPGDYNANGSDDYVVFRPTNGTWYIRDGLTAATVIQQFGQNLDKPAARDYDGDGKFDLAVFRPSNGVWYILNSYTQTVSIVGWGVSEDIPTPSEFSSDGKADIAVWRPSNGTWYVRASTGSIRIQPFGIGGDVPQVLDYGSPFGLADFAVFRPSTGTWYTLDAFNGQFAAFQFGVVGDIPASSYPIQQ